MSQYEIVAMIVVCALVFAFWVGYVNGYADGKAEVKKFIARTYPNIAHGYLSNDE